MAIRSSCWNFWRKKRAEKAVSDKAIYRGVENCRNRRMADLMPLDGQGKEWKYECK